MAPTSASNAEASSDGRTRPPRWDFALAQEQERAEIQPHGETREARRAHDRRAARREHTLVVGGVAQVERLGHGEADHRVPEELQPLVVPPSGVGVLVEPAAVDERLREQVAIADG